MSACAAILLAAGRSARLGRPKAALPWRGTTLLGWAAAELTAVASPLVVVLAADSPAGSLLPASDATLLVRVAGGGLGDSLAAGARTLAERAGTPAHLLIALVDQPLAGRRLYADLLAAARAGAGWAASDYGDGILGPPVCLPAAELAELATLTGDVGARAWLSRRAAAGSLATVPFPGGRFDVDTEADYARLLASS